MGAPILLVVDHSPSRSMRTLTQAALAGAHDPAIEGVVVRRVAALAFACGEAGADDFLAAAAYLLLTPANFGYMSGALKHVFDTTFLTIGGALAEDGSAAAGGSGTAGRPYGLLVHGRHDTAGAVRSVESVAGGLRWRQAAIPVQALGDITSGHLEDAYELGGTLAALLS